MKEQIKIIFLVIFGTPFIIISIMFTWEATRRSADDVAKINQSHREATFEKIQSCIDGGGMPAYYKNQFRGCKKNN